MNLVNNDLPFWSPVRVNLPKKTNLIHKVLNNIGFRVDSCFYLGSRQIEIYLPLTNSGIIIKDSLKRPEIKEINQGFFTITFKISLYALLAFVAFRDNSLNGTALALTPLLLKAIYKYGYAEPRYIDLGESLDFNKSEGQSRGSTNSNSLPDYFRDTRFNEESAPLSDPTHPMSAACSSGLSIHMPPPPPEPFEEKTQD